MDSGEETSFSPPALVGGGQIRGMICAVDWLGLGDSLFSMVSVVGVLPRG